MKKYIDSQSHSAAWEKTIKKVEAKNMRFVLWIIRPGDMRLWGSGGDMDSFGFVLFFLFNEMAGGIM